MTRREVAWWVDLASERIHRRVAAVKAVPDSEETGFTEEDDLTVKRELETGLEEVKKRFQRPA